MGSDLHVVVWAPASSKRLAELAAHRVELLEQCWSRFRPDSELNLLHARAGHGAVPVSEDLHRLVSSLVQAWSWSEGDVDATVLGGMVAMGYDKDFALVAAAPLPPSWERVPGQGMGDVRVGDGAVALPRGVGLDPGAIGKGLAGDIVTAEIAASGAHAVLVSIGGDVVTYGTPPDTGEWRISLRDDRTDAREEIGVVTLSGEARAVATSSTLRRRWSGRHHMLDPRTGSPLDSDVVQATVVADCGWRAEVGATVALVRGSSSAPWLAERGCTAYLLAGAPAHA
ncbi:MAG: FAD:protein FMN transferase [bacterium]